MSTDGPTDLIALTADIVSAHVSNNNVELADLPELIRTVHAALAATGTPPEAPAEAKPARPLSIRASIKPQHLISMIDGKPYKVLKRHLKGHGHTPESYRAAFDLPGDYPMVAADYMAQRRDIAQRIGLGRKPRIAPDVAVETDSIELAALPAKRRGRPPKALPSS